MGIVFGLIFDILLWGSAMILVGSGYLIFYFFKFLITCIERLFNSLEEKIENKKIRTNRRIVR